MICKYAAAIVTGSSAMLAEAFHSTADAGNELLLLLAMKRITRPPTLYTRLATVRPLFYSLLVAVYIFGVGGVLALYKGITHVKYPQFSFYVSWNYGGLALAPIFDFDSWRISNRELLARKDPDESSGRRLSAARTQRFLPSSWKIPRAWPEPFSPFSESSSDVCCTTRPSTQLLQSLLAILLVRESGVLLLGEKTNCSRVSR
jgi:hypothetical protein